MIQVAQQLSHPPPFGHLSYSPPSRTFSEEFSAQRRAPGGPAETASLRLVGSLRDQIPGRTGPGISVLCGGDVLDGGTFVHHLLRSNLQPAGAQ